MCLCLSKNKASPLYLDTPSNSTHHSCDASKGDHDLAIQDFTKCLELDAADALTHMFRGLAYSGRGDHSLAIQDYDKSLELHPDNAFTYRLRGSAYEEQGALDRAIQDHDKSIELDPSESNS